MRILEREGFVVHRIRGSHHLMKHPDGRTTTIPVHKNEDLPPGLLRKIVREDLKMKLEAFERMVRK